MLILGHILKSACLFLCIRMYTLMGPPWFGTVFADSFERSFPMLFHISKTSPEKWDDQSMAINHHLDTTQDCGEVKEQNQEMDGRKEKQVMDRAGLHNTHDGLSNVNGIEPNTKRLHKQCSKVKAIIHCEHYTVVWTSSQALNSVTHILYISQWITNSYRTHNEDM